MLGTDICAGYSVMTCVRGRVCGRGRIYSRHLSFERPRSCAMIAILINISPIIK